MSNAQPLYTVTTDDGGVFNVAAHGKREAMQMVQERSTRDGLGIRPTRAERVRGGWDADYGTVLWVHGAGWADGT